MQQLSTVLKTISITAPKTECVPAEPKFSLTKEDGKMITQELAQSKATSPAEYTDKILTLWKQLANLQKVPRRTYNFFGIDDADPPPKIEHEELDENAKQVIKEILNVAWEPISKAEFAVLYAKLKVLCKWHSVPADEKVIMAAYYDELKRYPAVLVREALKPQYEWFPSFFELEEKMKSAGEHLLLLKKLFG